MSFYFISKYYRSLLLIKISHLNYPFFFDPNTIIIRNITIKKNFSTTIKKGTRRNFGALRSDHINSFSCPSLIISMGWSWGDNCKVVLQLIHHSPSLLTLVYFTLQYLSQFELILFPFVFSVCSAPYKDTTVWGTGTQEFWVVQHRILTSENHDFHEGMSMNIYWTTTKYWFKLKCC